MSQSARKKMYFSVRKAVFLGYFYLLFPVKAFSFLGGIFDLNSKNQIFQGVPKKPKTML